MLTAAAVAVPLAGCESTVHQANRLTRLGASAFKEKGLALTHGARGIRVLSTAVLSDQNGGAVVVEIENTGREPLINVPISITVKDRKGRSVYRNSDPGLEPSLVRQPVLLPGKPVTWVNDQVQSSGGPPARVQAVPGAGTALKGAVPALEIGQAKLRGDPSSGVEAHGFVTNRSTVLQLRLPVRAVARRGKKIVAVGTGVIDKLPPGKRRAYNVYFIGNPRGADVTVTSVPVNLG